jgi:ammonium transporter, Amt family
VVGLKSVFGYDDSLVVFGIHGVAGIIGALLTGLSASKAIRGSSGGVMAQLQVHLKANNVIFDASCIK